MEKPIRALEREVVAMEKKNRTYTLLEDSDGEIDVPAEKETGRKKKSKEKGSKRKHIRQKKEESESSSEEEAPKKFVPHICSSKIIIRKMFFRWGKTQLRVV